MSILPRLLVSAALGAFALTSPALAQDCPGEPVFVSQRTADDDVGAAATRVERGDWRIAAHFAREALDGASTRNAGAAYVNLCAALANQGRDAGEACDQAVALSEAGWKAHTNRGAAHWLAGEIEAARSDFAAAAELAPDEEAVRHNNTLARCGSETAGAAAL